VVTVGFSDEILGGLRVISKIAGTGESVERAEKIVEALQNLPHLHMPPLAAVGSGDFPSVELPGDCVETCVARRLDVPTDR
jgi:hypothetical protein